jgi:hypothetical protein
VSDHTSLSSEDRAAVAEKVLAIVEKFVVDQRIHCPETIHQCDWVIENAYEFIEDLCEVAGYKEFDDE